MGEHVLGRLNRKNCIFFATSFRTIRTSHYCWCFPGSWWRFYLVIANLTVGSSTSIHVADRSLASVASLVSATCMAQDWNKCWYLAFMHMCAHKLLHDFINIDWYQYIIYTQTCALVHPSVHTAINMQNPIKAGPCSLRLSTGSIVVPRRLFAKVSIKAHNERQ